MKVINKVTVELTNEEYETLITAQQILHEIADNLDDNRVYTSEVEKYFDSIDDAYENILNFIEHGIDVDN